MRKIEVREIKGVFTNCDPADVPGEYASELQNLRPVNGKLVKTYGIGKRIDTALAGSIQNLAVLSHSSLTTPTGYIILGAKVETPTSGALKVYGYRSTPTWTDIRSLYTISSDVYFQKAAKNPIIKDSDTIRFLPGNVYDITIQIPITYASTADDTFRISGEHTETFVAGATFTVSVSTGNDGNYTVISSVYSGGNTTISVAAVPDGTGDGLITVSYVARGLWLGYIDRDYFDGYYLPTAGFYGYAARISAPALTFTLAERNGGTLNAAGTGQIAFYKFSYIYDGVQESLLTTLPEAWDCSQNVAVTNTFVVTDATWNKRITAMKVYRSIYDLATGVQSAYGYIQTIDFLREAGSLPSGANGAYTGHDWMHIPGLLSYTFDAGKDYRMLVNGRSYVLVSVTDITTQGLYVIDGDHSAEFVDVTEIFVEGCDDAGNNGTFDIVSVNVGTGPTTLILTSNASAVTDASPSDATVFRGNLYDITNPGAGDGSEVFSLDSSGPIPYDFWNTEWELWERTGTINEEAYGNAGCYTGWNTVIVPTDLVPNAYAGGVLTIGSYEMAIDTNSSRAVHMTNFIFANLDNQAWELQSTTNGIYTVTDGGATATYVFTDPGITAGASHPLDGEVSITVHGAHARIISGRLWQGDIVLDPGGANEVHADWVSYSEIDQPDVTPVSNVIRITDVEGGPVTGIAQLFGNPVILKRQAIITVDAKGQTPPFSLLESAHNIGNIAPDGYVSAGQYLFVIYRDGIYRLSPNNLAASDSTPTEQLKITNPIEDTYLALSQSQKEAIIGEYEPVREEVIWVFNTEKWAYNIRTETWREIYSAVTPAIFCRDENADLIVYQESDKKIYTFNEDTAKESVTVLLKSKMFEVSDIRKEVVRCVSITYKSSETLTLKVISDDNVPTGSIQGGVTYTVTGYTQVVYNGATITTGNTFVGVAGNAAYTPTGTGKVNVIKSYTIPINYDWTNYKVTPRLRCNRVTVQVSTSATNTAVEIGAIYIDMD